MEIRFRECDFFNLWIWLELENVPSAMEQQYIEEIFDSWFFLGKLGGFNAENLQVQDSGHEISYMDYDNDEAEDTLMAVMHNMSEVQFEGTWARCWFDLGTTDALALDVLTNTLKQFSKDYTIIQRVYIGGENEDWPIPKDQNADFVDAMH
ncbi:DUF3531 family protein [Leptothoe sp. PORK10 BA2]|uniref:DUF3531 family protein n=1 Tax=Leptothoe sp. PORK10 BA2 TaxID=3110254 RepID=UPI002B1FC328|nr:DUF3531 family protein [Leptothoe sp. PORK10 BA2]MEA5462847.1 DUF3531 family protein [Leptothoe sp. PORK10 BA2]